LNKPSANGQIELLKTLAPTVLALIGVGVFNGVAATDIRERYAFAADLVLWVGVSCMVLAMVAATYPVTLERPLERVVSRLGRVVSERREKAAFFEWIEHWGALTALIYDAYADNKPTGWLDERGPMYRAERLWLLEHEASIPRGALGSVIGTMKVQWPRRTTAEVRLERDGFFSFFRYDDYSRQYAMLSIESETGRGEHGHHPQHTLKSVWDGLNRYSIRRSWGILGDWEQFRPQIPSPEETGPPNGADPSTTVAAIASTIEQ